MNDDDAPDEDINQTVFTISREDRKRKQVETAASKVEFQKRCKNIRKILLCKAEDRSSDDCALLAKYPDIAENVQRSLQKYLMLKSRKEEVS